MKNTKHLSDLVALVNDANRRVAMTTYLNGEAHLQFLVAQKLADRCRAGTEELTKAYIVHELDIAYDAEVFAAILTNPAYFSYDGCDLVHCDEEDPDVSFPEDGELDDKTYGRLAKLPPDELLEVLKDDPHYCEGRRFIQRHAADTSAQRAYCDAVLDRFACAAEYAMKIGAEATARRWLEAGRLLMPRIASSCRPTADCHGLNLVPANVQKAYRVAEEAQAMLWVDERYRVRSAALKAPKKPKAKKR